ncbi:glycosyltransferase [Candidatus Clostridium radicumherbarum]|uniref:Glycosyltransferase n=1 Tax=Candidatus Clostridium radicumherbarum TaxID=3381662 RepID=A0ABW8TWU1_9CLOT
MKVLIISHMYPSTFNEMSGIFVHQQVKALIKQGCEVKVISPIPLSVFPMNIMSSRWKKYSMVPKFQLRDNVEIYYPRYVEFPKGMFMEYSGYFMYLGIKDTIKEIYNNFKFDIIQSHVALPDGYASILVSKRYNIPQVVTVHGQDLQYTIFKNEKCKKKLFKTFNFVDKIITVSNKLKEVVKTENFYNKMTVINNGVDLDEINEIRKEINTYKNNSEFRIVSASNLIKTKGIDLNIKAVSILLKKYPGIKYYIIGDGEEKNNLQELVNSLNLNKNIFFLGKLEHKEVIKYMFNANIFSMPSWQEGFGMVYIEAMACGKPVIGVQGEGIQDAIIDKENGLLVNPQNIESLVQAIDFLISNPDKADYIGKNAKESVINNFTWDINAKKTVEIYEHISKASGGKII